MVVQSTCPGAEKLQDYFRLDMRTLEHVNDCKTCLEKFDQKTSFRRLTIKGKALSFADFIALVNQGGWKIAGNGNHLISNESEWLIGSVTAKELGLVFDCQLFEEKFTIPYDLIYHIALIDPATIEVHQFYVSRQLRKKREGGGYREIPTTKVILRLSRFIGRRLTNLKVVDDYCVELTFDDGSTLVIEHCYDNHDRSVLNINDISLEEFS